MRDNKELYKYIHAFILGDGGVYTNEKTGEINARFSSTKTEANVDLLEFEQKILEEFISTTLIKYDGHPTTINGVETYTKPYYRLRTKSHPIFTKFRNRMYLYGKKVIDPHYLKLLDWETLAILYMDDGTFSKQKYSSHIELCTQNFSYGDNLMLKEQIRNVLGIEFNIVRRHRPKHEEEFQYSLSLRTKDHEKFYENVKSYIVPSFLYKIESISRLTNSEKSDEEMI